ncbi:MAG TPA: family 10 glycosylhydrolase [Chroococcales cyanobacterium]
MAIALSSASGLFLQSLIAPLPAYAAAPVAVLKSARNSSAYQEEHLGTFDDDWQTFKQSIEAANIRYDELGDADVAQGPARISEYKLIVVPLLVDVPANVVSALADFERGGGKLLITDAGGNPLAGAQALEKIAGVTFVKQSTSTNARTLAWPATPLPLNEEFAVGSVSADVTLSDGATALATWTEAGGQTVGTAVAKRGNSIFLTWGPGLQGDVTANAKLLAMAMENLSTGITQQSAVQISFAEFQTMQQELEYLMKRTDETIKTAKQADLSVPVKIIDENYSAGVDHVHKFEEAYHNRHFYEADQYLQKARHDFSLAFAEAMPVRPVEARSVWLDRGTIVTTHDAYGMAKLFDRLKASGINVVYFETNNAGYAMFPSEVATQNPQVLGWDPLGCAIKEAHKRGIELHAWLWTFNVGNSRHNPIIGKDADFPGPVLSSHDFSWALASQSGSLMPPRQHEFWIDPSNPDGCKYIKSLYLEVVKKYPVDGIQMDYIRYPFNGKGTEMGFNWLGRMRFEQESGMSLDHLDNETRTVWQAWKIQQVNNFVKDLSQAVRQTRPGTRISAAVYALPRRWRLSAIEQEWETWVANGWVDTLNPMTYVQTAKELATNASYVRETTFDHALVYPGLSIRTLDTAGLIEQLDTSRLIGTMGTTMFACAHLDDKKMDMLKSGPYRRQPLLTPQSDPYRAARLLTDDFAAMVNRYLMDPKKHILSDQASTNDVLMQIEAIQKNMRTLGKHSTAEQIEAVNKDVTNLHNTIKEWLRLEAFIQRGFRAQYIANYLGQVEAILSYSSHKARALSNSLADTQQPQTSLR